MCSFAVTSHATQFTGQFPNLINQTFIFTKTSETRFILVGALRNQKPSGETSLSWASQFPPQNLLWNQTKGRFGLYRPLLILSIGQLPRVNYGKKHFLQNTRTCAYYRFFRQSLKITSSSFSCYLFWERTR